MATNMANHIYSNSNFYRILNLKQNNTPPNSIITIPSHMTCTIQFLCLGEWYTVTQNIHTIDGKPKSFHFNDTKNVIHRFIIGESTYDSIYERIGPPCKICLPVRWICENSDQFINLYSNNYDEPYPESYTTESDYSDFSDDSEGRWFSR